MPTQISDTRAVGAQEQPDGTQLGRNADSKVGFYGTAPIAQQVLAPGAAVAAVVAALQALGLTKPA